MRIDHSNRKSARFRSEIDQSIREMTLYDRDLFAWCATRGRDMVGKMLSIPLGRAVSIGDVRAESFVPNTEGKSPVLDAIASGCDGSVYGIEMQRRGERMGPRRISYYQASLTAECLGKGDDYDSLPDRFLVVFFERGLPPPFRDGRPVHTLSIRDEKTGRELGDGMAIVLVDGSYRGEDGLGVLLKDMSESDPDKIVTGEIKEQMLYFKKGEGRKEMSESIERLIRKAERMAEERGESMGRTKGRAEGIESVAKNMAAKGYSREQIYDLTGVEL